MPASFEVRNLPQRRKARLYLVQLPFETSGIDEVDRPTTRAQIEGKAADAAMPALRRVAGVDEIGESPLPLSDSQAATVGLIFHMVGSRKTADTEAMAGKIAAMSHEDASYWLRLMTSDPERGADMRKALSILLSA